MSIGGGVTDLPDSGGSSLQYLRGEGTGPRLMASAVEKISKISLAFTRSIFRSLPHALVPLVDVVWPPKSTGH